MQVYVNVIVDLDGLGLMKMGGLRRNDLGCMSILW